MRRKYMAYSVYILYSKSSGKYYVGSTASLADRLNRHNTGGSQSTRFGAPWSLVYREEYGTRAAAVEREKQIKSYHGGEAFKKLIAGNSSAGGGGIA